MNQVNETSADCGCNAINEMPQALSRRDFFKTGGLASALLLAGRMPVMAGPFTGDDFKKLVPEDKKLTDAWVRSLFQRGQAEWYAGDELKHIGMPVGGICCGQVYLSGDGRLWHWDIFNRDVSPKNRHTGPHYAKPIPVESDVDIGFSIQVNARGKQVVRALDKTGFSDVRFRGAYPIGFVEYKDASFPVDVSLEAFSPFTPLDVDASSLPLTVMRYTVRNKTNDPLEVSLAGKLANPVLLHSGNQGVELLNQIVSVNGATCLTCTANASKGEKRSTRPDIVFEDFESDTYENWTVEGTAFGEGPVLASEMPAYQKDIGASGKRLVNSHNTRQGESHDEADAHTGVMTSKPFTIERRYITALVGGGSKVKQTALRLLVDGKVVASLAGDNKNKLERKSFDVAEYAGKRAQLRIEDKRSAGWGNIGVDQIVFCDQLSDNAAPLSESPDMGDMTLAVLGDEQAVFSSAQVSGDSAESIFVAGPEKANNNSARPRGGVGKTVSLAPGAEATISFAVSWRFPNQPAPKGSDVTDKGHYYAKRFDSSLAVMAHHSAEAEESYQRTRLWHDTWNDSTLPQWLLDRTFVNTSTLATSTCLRFDNGRFWGWEGVGCCAGTCTHVWHYAQAVGRLFPELEQITREHVDYGIAYQPDGRMFYRAEMKRAAHEAIDGQCGTILRVYREHTMSPDSDFLGRIWPRVKQSILFLIKEDGDKNGILEGAQHNTLDAAWYGPISWISSLYLAALRAGSAMAKEMGDTSFAEECDVLVKRGTQWISENLFDGEYFFHQRDPDHPNTFGAGIGCHIDQVMGQWWVHQVGLDRVLPEDKTRSALQSLWRYNFTPDVGPYRKEYKGGRWYAMPGEAGLIMCTFPKGGEKEARGGKAGHTFAGYFNECMNGFEYQAAGHMIAEGLVQEGLAVTRAVHDRYHPTLRNPYNEIECSDHYARSMASYGVFISLCGFEHHGPEGKLAFAPRMQQDDFKAAFTTAEGWGQFSQTVENAKQTNQLRMHYGQLNLNELRLENAPGTQPGAALVALNGEKILTQNTASGTRSVYRFPETLRLSAGDTLTVKQS